MNLVGQTMDDCDDTARSAAPVASPLVLTDVARNVRYA